MFSLEAAVEASEYPVVIHLFPQVHAQDMLEQLTSDTSQRNRAVILGFTA